MPTDTFYPSGDGPVRYYDGTGTWSSIRGQASGTDAYPTANPSSLVYSDASLPLILRGFLTFDTSALPDDAVVTSARVRVYGQAKTGSSGYVCIVDSTHGVPVAVGDYSKAGTTELSDAQVSMAGFSTSGYNDFVLNAAGLAAINLTGVSKFAFRHSSDLTNSAPGSTQSASIYYSEETGTTKDPILEVTYVTVTAKTASDSGTGSDSGTASVLPTSKSASDSGSATDSASAMVVVKAASGVTTYGDDCTDTNGTNLESHTPSGAYGGGSWSRSFGTTANTHHTINTNRVYTSDPSVFAVSCNTVHSLSASDGSIAADMTIGATVSGCIANVTWRDNAAGSAGSTQRYMASLDPADVFGGGTGKLYLFKVLAGTRTELGSYSVGAMSGTYNVKLEVQGSALRVYLDGVLRISATDSAITGPDHPGIATTIGSSHGTGDGVLIDNIVITDGVATLADPSDSATATETASSGQVTTPVAASDSAAGTDTSATKAIISPSGGTPGSPLTRSGYAARESVFTGGTVGTFGAHYAFPSAVTLDDRTRVIVARKATTHGTYDGNLVLKTRSAAGSYSSEVTIVDTAYDERDPNIVKLSSGRLVLVWQQRQTHSPLARFYPMFAYCDGDPTNAANWSSPQVITTGHDANVAIASDIIEMANGDLYVVTYGRATEAASTWDVRISKSTNGGTTWTDHASVCTAAQLSGANAVEPQLELRANGDLYVSLHAESSPQYAYYCTASSPFTSWSSPTQIVGSTGSFTAYNRGGLLKTVDGDWIFAYGPTNDSPYFRQSTTEGATWGSAIAVADSSTSPYIGDVWVTPFTIGAAGASPNLAFVWGMETSPGQAQANIYYREFTPGATAPTNGSGMDSATGTDTGSVTVGVGAIAKTATDSATCTDTGTRSAITRYVVASDSAIAVDSSGNNTAPKLPVRIVKDTYVTSAQFGSRTVSSAMFGDRTVYIHPESTIEFS